jgi:hypothetical protein
LILKPSQKVLDFDIKTFTEDRRHWTLILKPSQKTLDFDIKTFTEDIGL